MNPQKAPTSLLRGTSIVSSLTLLSRILGFVREILVARLFGSNLYADAYFVALRIPNLLRSIFAEGALTSAFVPVFSKELARGDEHARQAIRSVTSLLLICTAVISILGVVYAPDIVHLFAPGFGVETDRFTLCVSLTRIMFPYILFVSLVAMLNGALNSVKIFGTSALAQVIMNVILIVGAIVAAWFDARTAALILGWSVLGGGVVQVIAQMPTLQRAGFSIVPSFAILTPAVRGVLRLMIPAILGAAVYQISVFLNTQLASVLSQGSVSWLSYADRLTQLPIGVFTIALASVLLPALSHAEASENREEFGKNLVNSLRYSSFIMLPVAAGIFTLSESLIQLMFERGAFDHNATIQTAFAVRMYCVGLWGVSCHSMVVRAFNAKHDTQTPTIIGVLSLLMTFTLSLLFMGTPQSEHSSRLFEGIASIQAYLRDIFPSLELGHGGLALSSAISFTISFTLISMVFKRKYERTSWGLFYRSTGISVVASVAMALSINWVAHFFMSPYQKILFAGLSGIALYLLVSYLLGGIEVRESIHRIRKVSSRK